MKHVPSSSENIIWSPKNEEKSKKEHEVVPPPPTHPKPITHKTERAPAKPALKKAGPVQFFSEAIRTALAPTDWPSAYASRMEKRKLHLTKSSDVNIALPAINTADKKDLDKLEEQLKKLKQKEEDAPQKSKNPDPFDEEDLF